MVLISSCLRRYKNIYQVFSAREADATFRCVDFLDYQYSYTLHGQVIPVVRLRAACTPHPAAYLH